MLRAAGAKYTPPSTPSGGVIPIVPALWYKNSDIPAGGFGSWANSGTLGTGYTMSPFSSTPSVGTVGPYKSVDFSSTNSLRFNNGVNITLHQSSQATPFCVFAVARVNSGGYCGFVTADQMSPSYPDGIGPQNHPTHYEWYDNDGGPFTATFTSATNSQLTQYIYYHQSDNSVQWYESKTASATLSTTGSYGANLSMQGIGWISGAQPSGTSVCELLVYTNNLTPSQMQSIRNYLGQQYPATGRVNA